MVFSTGLAARLACRSGAPIGSTAGAAPGSVQGNLTILPGRMLVTDLQNAPLAVSGERIEARS
jgi:uncharacterized protein YcsI (UPF0317 family)